MKAATIIIAAMAIFGATLAKSVLDGGNSLPYPDLLIFEKEVIDVIDKAIAFLKEKDPLTLKNFKFDHFGLWFDASEIHGKGFSDVALTDLKISILKNFEAEIKLPAVSGYAGPFKGGLPTGELYSNGQNHFSMEGGTLKVKGKVTLEPAHVSDLSFELQVNGAKLKLEKINDDPEYTEELNKITNEFLTKTINDKEWQNLVTKDVEQIVNDAIKAILG